MEKFAALFIVAALFVSCSDETTDLLDEGNYVGVNSELYSGLGVCLDCSRCGRSGAYSRSPPG